MITWIIPLLIILVFAVAMTFIIRKLPAALAAEKEYNTKMANLLVGEVVSVNVNSRRVDLIYADGRHLSLSNYEGVSVKEEKLADS